MASKVLAYIALATALYFVPNVLGYQTLSQTNGQFIEQLFESFNCPFQDIRFRKSVQFGVLTMETNVNDLTPAPFQFGEGQLSQTVNYYAETPTRVYVDNGRYSDNHGRYNLVHVEDQLAQSFDNWITGDPSITDGDVYILTYYSPCNDCARILANLANNYPNFNFHIGYRVAYGQSLESTRELLGPQNIFFGSVTNYGQCSSQSNPQLNRKRNANECIIICDFPAFWGEWMPYGVCSRSCGGGMKIRQRTCYLDGEAPGQCNGPASESQWCNTQACPYWSSWGSWCECSSCSDGWGSNYRYRICYGGNCPGVNRQSQSCQCPACFASDSMVRVKIPSDDGANIQRKRLDQLKVGEHVESFDPETNSAAFSEVYFISHEEETGNSSLLTKLVVGFDDGKELSLRLSSKHLVYACHSNEKAEMSTGPGSDSCRYPPVSPMTAESVKVGDIVWVRNTDGEFSPRPVIDIEESWSGVRHPMTLNHYIVIDDILASVHVFNEDLYRQITAPLRFLYGISPSITETGVVKKLVQMWDTVEENYM